MAGMGSIEKRGKNTWRLIASRGMKAGRQIKKARTVTVKAACDQAGCRSCTRTARCPARREAEKLLAEFILEIEKGLFLEPSRLTFKDFSERWLRDYGEKELAPKTLHRYKEMLEGRIFPAMGHIKVEKLKPIHLVDFYTNLREDGIRRDGKEGSLSDQTRLHHHRLISAILQAAVEWEVIPSNPAKKVKPPKCKKRKATCYNEEQTAALLTALEAAQFKHRIIVTLALVTGFRRGELMGLDWEDVDFENGTIEVHQASQYLPGKGVFTKDPKTEESNRTLSIPQSVTALLKQYRAHQAGERLKVGSLWQGSPRLFTTWDGRPMHPDSVSCWFNDFLKKHKLPHLPFHGLRHTAASLLIAEGIPVKNISARLGHSDIRTTMNIYGHAFKSVDREAADRLDHLFAKNEQA